MTVEPSHEQGAGSAAGAVGVDLLGGGELIFANGSRIAGELSNEALMVSTGSGLVEIAPDEVVTLSREEIRLRDGRVIRGTLVGGQLKARTSLGEITVKVDELQSYQSGLQTSQPASGGARPAARSRLRLSDPARCRLAAGGFGRGKRHAERHRNRGRPADDGGVWGSQQGRQGNATATDSVQDAALTTESRSTLQGRTYEVVGESVLYRDALLSSSRVGRVASGQQVSYVDSIDRRLRILNLLVFDGGHWVKIRLPDGVEGWVPADSVREVR